MWRAFLPGAVVPLWQLAQLPVTAEWSTRVTGDQALTRWQLAQAAVLWICRADFPVALRPLWQPAQLLPALP